jgi:rubrerythrin
MSGDLLELLEKQYEVEKNAFMLYSSQLDEIKDEKIRAEIAEIRDDEAEHMKLVKEMIGLVTLQK